MDVSSRHSITELQERQKQTNDAYPNPADDSRVVHSLNYG
jgi:hypothetical protein